MDTENRSETESESEALPDLPPDEICVSLIEALLFVHAEPLCLKRIAEVTNLEHSMIVSYIERLRERLVESDSAFTVVEVGGKAQLRTRSQFSHYIQKLKDEKPRKLTRPSLETLSIVAYRQPITKSEIERIRGVDSLPTLKTLLKHELISIIGYKEAVGQPALYATTDRFLEVFGLRSLRDLPAIRELAQLERDPGEVELEQVVGS